MIVAVVIAIWAIANKRKKISRLQRWLMIRTHGLCVSAAVLYRLSYEDPCTGSRPICWVHLNPWVNCNYLCDDHIFILKISPGFNSCPKRSWRSRGISESKHKLIRGAGDGGGGGRILNSSLASLFKKPQIPLEPCVAALFFSGQVTMVLLFVYSFPTNPVSSCYRCEAPNSQCTPVMYDVSLDVPMVGDNSCCVGVYIDQAAMHWRWIFEEYWSNIYLIRLNCMQIIISIIIIIVINIFIIVLIIVVVVMTTK